MSNTAKLVELQNYINQLLPINGYTSRINYLDLRKNDKENTVVYIQKCFAILVKKSLNIETFLMVIKLTNCTLHFGVECDVAYRISYKEAIDLIMAEEGYPSRSTLTTSITDKFYSACEQHLKAIFNTDLNYVFKEITSNPPLDVNYHGVIEFLKIYW